MQGSADGYFIALSMVTAWLAGTPAEGVPTDHPDCREALESTRLRISQLINSEGNTPVDSFHRELGSVMIDRCGISRHADGLRQDGAGEGARTAFEAEAWVPGEASGPNAELEKALWAKDFFGLAQPMLRDALAHDESCGAHFREEHQSDEGEAQWDDVNFAHIAAWEHNANS